MTLDGQIAIPLDIAAIREPFLNVRTNAKNQRLCSLSKNSSGG